MGISNANYWTLVTVKDRLGTFSGKRILELGNQVMREWISGRKTSKDYFNDQGVMEHVYFDLNGQDGAVPVDLTAPVPAEYHNRFDLVTNFGTSEHILNQRQVFKTIHDCCRTGGYMVHSVPLDGYWKRHSPYHYKPGFAVALAEKMGYAMVESDVNDRGNDKLLTFVLYKRADSLFAGNTFPMGEITQTSNYPKNTDNLQ